MRDALENRDWDNVIMLVVCFNVFYEAKGFCMLVSVYNIDISNLCLVR